MEDLADGHTVAETKIRKRRMRPVVVRISEETIPIVSRIRIIEIREEEDKDQEDEAFVEHVFTVEKVIGQMNVLNAKERQLGELKARLELHMWMKMLKEKKH